MIAFSVINNIAGSSELKGYYWGEKWLVWYESDGIYHSIAFSVNHDLGHLVALNQNVMTEEKIECFV